MKDRNAEPDRNGDQPIMDSANSTIVELAGNEDTTIRPLRACLARLTEHKGGSAGTSPAQQTDSSSPDRSN